MTSRGKTRLKDIGFKLTNFKYHGAIVSDEGSKPKVLSSIAQAIASLTKLKPIWCHNNIYLGSKVKQMRFLIISIFLNACESWTLTAELKKRKQAFEMRNLLDISFKDHVINEFVRRKIQASIGKYDELLTLVKKLIIRWFCHISRSSCLANTILQDAVQGKRRKVHRRRSWKTLLRTGQGWNLLTQLRLGRKAFS